MQQSHVVMGKVDREDMLDPKQWIQQNMGDWRSKYLQKVGVQLSSEKQNDDQVLQVFQLNFIARTNDDVRNNYIQKLINNKCMQQQKKHQTLTIFDWDDTLLPTTYLGCAGIIDVDKLECGNGECQDLYFRAHYWIRLVHQVMCTQQPMLLKGGWSTVVNCNISSKLSWYMNKVFQVIFDKKIIVVSARAGYENLFPGECGKWKIEAFRDISAKYENDVFTNIICIGDSNIEMDAGHILAKEFNMALIKTIKFRECPKPEELVKQQELMIERFEFIYTQFKNLTIRLEKQQTQIIIRRTTTQ